MATAEQWYDFLFMRAPHWADWEEKTAYLTLREAALHTQAIYAAHFADCPDCIKLPGIGNHKPCEALRVFIDYYDPYEDLED